MIKKILKNKLKINNTEKFNKLKSNKIEFNEMKFNKINSNYKKESSKINNSKNKTISKSGNITFIFVITFIGIIGFFIIFNNLISNSNYITNKAQDLNCKSLILGKSSKIGKIYDFFYGINLKCKSDKITISSNTKPIIFKKIADEELRCWEKYGSGKKDFLSNYNTKGNWCFKCGEISFKEKNKMYNYNEFVNFLKNTNVERKSNSKKFSESFNFKYEETSLNDLFKIKSQIQSILNENDPSLKELGNVLANQYIFSQNLRNKKIDSNKKLYIIYKFDRLDTNFKDKLSSASNGAKIGLGLDILGSTILENSALYLGTSLACLGSFTGILAPICGAGIVTSTAKTTSSVSKNIIKTGKNFKDLSLKIIDISKNLGNSVKFSLKSSKFSSINRFKLFGGEIKYMSKVSKALKNTKNENKIKLSEMIDETSLKMSEMGFNSLYDINEEILKNKDKLKILHKITDNSMNFNFMSGKSIDKAIKIESKYSNKINELNSLKNKIKEIKEIKTPQDLNLYKKYLSSFFLLSGIAAGAIISSNLDFNSNQYIEIMNKDEYFRTCGTLSYSKN